MAGLDFAEPAQGFSEICGYNRRGNTAFQPGAAQFSSNPPGNHKFDPSSPENSWDPDPSLKDNARIGSRSEHDPRASGGPGAGTPRGTPKQVPKRCLSSTSDRDGRGGCSRGPGERGGHGMSRCCGRSPCAAWNPIIMPRSAAVSCRPAADRGATRRSPGIQPRRVSRIDCTHGPPWGPLGGP